MGPFNQGLLSSIDEENILMLGGRNFLLKSKEWTACVTSLTILGKTANGTTKF